METGVHLIVEGLVQGVGFRWYVARHADALGLRGYTKNLFNGNVEIEAEGDRSLLEEFIAQVKVGPRAARITNLQVTWTSPTHRFLHFEIR